MDPYNAPSNKKRKLPFEKQPKIEIHEDTRTKTIFLTGNVTSNSIFYHFFIKINPRIFRYHPSPLPLNTSIGPDSLRQTVTSATQAMELIKRGTLSRTVASTNMNESSSRSHSILTFYIESRENTVNASSFKGVVPPVHLGKLNLVDLAGSERINKSGILNSEKRPTNVH